MIPFLHRLRPATAEDNPLWLVVLADMMTNLMLFFLVMFALSQQGPQAQQAMARTFDAESLVNAKPPNEAARREFLEREAAAKLKELFKRADVTEQTIHVSLQSEVLFASGQAELSAAAGPTIQKLAEVLRQMPNTIIVEGHTDDVPLAASPYRSNWELSVARSYSVIERLRAAEIAPERLVAAGYGPFHPAAPNDAPEGRARNRRVEIVILRGDGKNE